MVWGVCWRMQYIWSFVSWDILYMCVSIRDKEVDFVAMKDDRVIYLQTTYMLETEQTIEREYSPLLSIKDNDEKYVVSVDEMQLPLKREYDIFRFGI